MFIPTLPTDPMVEEDKKNSTYDTSKPWKNYFEQNQSNMQLALSDEGFWIPSVSSASDSVTPPATGGQIAQLEATFGQQNGSQAGTLIFDPAEVNGGTSMDPNGQLKVLLNDGLFHSVTNT